MHYLKQYLLKPNANLKIENVPLKKTKYHLINQLVRYLNLSLVTSPDE